MSRKPPNLRLSLPRCMNCHRYWRPAEGMVSTNAFCPKCAKPRQAVAVAQLGLKPITRKDLTGRFLLPRRLRAG
jgi:hypothetical protein